MPLRWRTVQFRLKELAMCDKEPPSFFLNTQLCSALKEDWESYCESSGIVCYYQGGKG